MSLEKKERRVIIRRALLFSLLALLVICVLLRVAISIFDAWERQNRPFSLTVLDVGQSDAMLLQCDGMTMLIDAAIATEERALLAELAYCGIDRIDYMVLTHPHEDHIGNARVLMDRYEVGTVLVPDTASDEMVYAMTLESAASRAEALQTAKRGDQFALGSAKVEVLQAGGNHKNQNNDSIILRVSYRDLVFLFMGDAEIEAEGELLAAYDAAYLDCDFLKVGHHGSNTATGEALLAVTTPTVATIGCGELNEYGFPHREVIDGLSAIGAEIWRTDIDGTLVFLVDEEGNLYESEGER